MGLHSMEKLEFLKGDKIFNKELIAHTLKVESNYFFQQTFNKGESFLVQKTRTLYSQFNQHCHKLISNN